MTTTAFVSIAQRHEIALSLRAAAEKLRAEGGAVTLSGSTLDLIADLLDGAGSFSPVGGLALAIPYIAQGGALVAEHRLCLIAWLEELAMRRAGVAAEAVDKTAWPLSPAGGAH